MTNGQNHFPITLIGDGNHAAAQRKAVARITRQAPKSAGQDVDLDVGDSVTLEFVASEDLVPATVVRRSKQPLGWGWTFDTKKRGRVFVYERDMTECKPIVLVTDGR